MAFYLIADIEVTDPAGFEEYRAQVPAVIAAHGGKYLVRGGALEMLEGSWLPKRCIILEFPDMEHAKAFWDSPEYTPLRVIRERTAISHIVTVQGYTPKP